MRLYTYWRSTTSLRIRAALNLKGIAYEPVPVDLLKGAQNTDAFGEINPTHGVPVLELDDGTRLMQSHAIAEYLDTISPEPRLFPADPLERARVQAAALTIAMEIHPVNNLRILGYLKGRLGHSQDEAVTWMQHWMAEGFAAFQRMIAPDTPFCFGDAPTYADLCLVGQMVNARRWGLDLSPFARLAAIDAHAQTLPEIAAAMPENQPDAT
ncbi:Maleylacetoacetate isomerase [Candidatus Rhodobacter oscarellae]|uniref:Maleylacetoacetate isomerase n=1 Tax=Candidatus Rhodobacter oscarellae TaxID=1675527 RepID=A0A0J9E877_9RHOB|nr:maleylacetoacetate isomerase [Candidatus Rhodobacter lobularis]KMW58932.1 Maleylacetoacetate isomerase [Candidatus Rhodobacter lobularis]